MCLPARSYSNATEFPRERARVRADEPVLARSVAARTSASLSVRINHARLREDRKGSAAPLKNSYRWRGGKYAASNSESLGNTEVEV